MIYGQQLTPDDALQKLVEGNVRFSEDHMLHSENSRERRQMVQMQQRPFAVIVSCSDSRVPPEILFDQSIGDLFIVRVAGNIVGQIELESVSFAPLYLNTPLIFVLGHESCGAIDAVINHQTRDIPSIAKYIQSSVVENTTVRQVTENNVRHGMQIIQEKIDLAQLIAQKKLKVVGGYFNLVSGKVELISSL